MTPFGKVALDIPVFCIRGNATRFLLGLIGSAVLLIGQNPSKEYIRLGGRVIGIQNYSSVPAPTTLPAGANDYNNCGRMFSAPDGKRWFFTTPSYDVPQNYRHVYAYRSEDGGVTWTYVSEWYDAGALTHKVSPQRHPTNPNRVIILNMTRSGSQGGLVVKAKEFDLSSGQWVAGDYGGAWPVSVNTYSTKRVVSRKATGELIALSVDGANNRYAWLSLVPGGAWTVIGTAISVSDGAGTDDTLDYFLSGSGDEIIVSEDGWVIGTAGLCEAAGQHWTQVYQLSLSPSNAASHYFMFRESDTDPTLGSIQASTSGALAMIGSEVFLANYFWTNSSYLDYIRIGRFSKDGSFSGWFWTSPAGYSNYGELFAVGEHLYNFASRTGDRSWDARFWRWTWANQSVILQQENASVDAWLGVSEDEDTMPNAFGMITEGLAYLVAAQSYWEIPIEPAGSSARQSLSPTRRKGLQRPMLRQGGGVGRGPEEKSARRVQASGATRSKTSAKKRRTEWQGVLDAETRRWSAMSCDRLIAELHEVRVYEVEVESRKYQVEAQLLENTDKYVHIAIEVDNSSLPASLSPLTHSFMRRKDDRGIEERRAEP